MYCNDVKPVAAGFKGQLLQFAVLPGRIRKLTDLKLGQPKHPDYDSNLSPSGFELIMFDEKCCLPQYVIDFHVSHAPGIKFTGSKEQKGYAGH